jgi:hypothetical protein
VLYFSVWKLKISVWNFQFANRNITKVHNAHGYIRSKAITKTTFYKDIFRCITIPLYIKRNRPSRYYNNCLTDPCFNNNTTCIYLLLFEVVVYVTEHGRRLF